MAKWFLLGNEKKIILEAQILKRNVELEDSNKKLNSKNKMEKICSSMKKADTFNAIREVLH